jgi:hypothetical protein
MCVNYSARATVIGGLLIGAGWLFAIGPVAAAESVPQPAPIGIHYAAFNCPMGGAFSGVEYVQDPSDSNAYYVCSGGLPQQHLRCPNSTVLNMNTNPPTCVPWRAPYGGNN